MDDLENQKMDNLNSQNEEESSSNDNNEKLYSQDEVNEIIKNRLSRERKKYNKILNEEEFNKDLLKREKEVSLREMKADAKEILTNSSIPLIFIDLINFQDRDTMTESLETIKKINQEVINKWVVSEVNKRLPGKTPSSANDTILSRDPLKEAFKLKE